MAQIDGIIFAALQEELTVLHAVLRHDDRARYLGTTKRFDVLVDLYRLNLPALDPYPEDTYVIGVTSSHGIGGERMSTFVGRVLARAKPQFAILTGIAAAVAVKYVDLGDVVAASQIYSYNDVAVDGDQFEFRTQGYQVDALLRRAVGHLGARLEDQERWREDRVREIEAHVERFNEAAENPDIRPPPAAAKPRLVVETGAGGPFLIRSEGFRDSLKGKMGVHPKLAWVEMESAGFMEATTDHRVPAMVIKGISDLGDEAKTRTEDDTGGYWRLAAACNAAATTIEALRLRPFRSLGVNSVRLDGTTDGDFAVRQRVLSTVQGSQTLGFPRLMRTLGPCLGLSLEVSALEADGTTVAPDASHHTIESYASDSQGVVMSRSETGIKWKFDDSESRFEFGAVLILPRPATRLKVTIERTISETFEDEVSLDGR